MDSRDATVHAKATMLSTWHLHWQAALGQTFLPKPGLAERIRDRLIAAHTRRHRVLIDYLILPTEIHLITCIADSDTPGKVAGSIGNVVGRWVREAAHVRSPVMGGPFHSCVLKSGEAVRREIRMLAWRPVVLGLCRGPTFHPHGALRVALGMRPADGFDSRPMLHLFGESAISARPSLGRWIAHRPSDFDSRAWELARRLTRAACNDESHPTCFLEVKTSEAAALVAMAGIGGVEAALGLLADWVSWRLDPRGATNLHKAQDAQAARGRAIVARLAAEHSLCSAAFVARHFGKAKATLSEQVSTSRRREADTRLVSVPMALILKEIVALKTMRGRMPGVEYGATERP